MLSKEKFCELMNKFESKFRENEEWATKLYEVLGNVDEIYSHDYMAITIKAIDYAMECKSYSDDTTDITWWIFEDDFGKKGLNVNIRVRSIILTAQKNCTI